MKTLPSIAVALCLVPAWAVAGDTKPSGKATKLGQAIVQFGTDNLGKAVGEPPSCFAFVHAALKSVGAKTTADYGVNGANADYVWGKLLFEHKPDSPKANFGKVQPGDVLQLRNVQAKFKLVQPNGSAVIRSWGAAHHSSIVAKNLGGGQFVVLEQNYNGKEFVVRNTIGLSEMSSGTVWFYRPVAK